MQRVCEMRGGLAAYLRDPDMLVTAEARKCPYCQSAHLLVLHGRYYRQAILASAPQRGAARFGRAAEG